MEGRSWKMGQTTNVLLPDQLPRPKTGFNQFVNTCVYITP